MNTVTLPVYRNARSADVYPFTKQYQNFDMSLVRNLQICLPAVMSNISKPLTARISVLQDNKLIMYITGNIPGITTTQVIVGVFQYTGQLYIELQSSCGATGLLTLNHKPQKYIIDNQPMQLVQSCVLINPSVGNISGIQLQLYRDWRPNYKNQIQPQYIQRIPVKDNKITIQFTGMLDVTSDPDKVTVYRSQTASDRLNTNKLSVGSSVTSILGVGCQTLTIKTPNHDIAYSSLQDNSDAQLLTLRINSNVKFPGCSDESRQSNT